MILVLFTTGKNPSKASKLLAAALSLSVPYSRFEARGKRTVEQLLAKAAKRHYARFCTISEENGKPHALSFLSLDGSGGWARLPPKILLRKMSFTKEKQEKKQSQSLAMTGTKKRTLQKLFGSAGEESDEPESFLSSSATKLEVILHGKRILSLGVSYE